MELLQLRTLKAYRLSGSRSHTTVLDPCTLSVALQLRLSSPSSCDGDRLAPPSLETEIPVKLLDPFYSDLQNPGSLCPHPPAIFKYLVICRLVVFRQPPTDCSLVVDFAIRQVDKRGVWN